MKFLFGMLFGMAFGFWLFAHAMVAGGLYTESTCFAVLSIATLQMRKAISRDNN